MLKEMFVSGSETEQLPPSPSKGQKWPLCYEEGVRKEQWGGEPASPDLKL